MANTERTGQIIRGRYRILSLLGAGSQGKVYRAEDLARAGELVAIKLVEQLVGGRRDTSADHVLRWFRHPGWATVLDVGSWGESGWFEVTRFVRGDNLLALEGAQDEELVWAFLEQGARVLGALHRQGVLHYDVTPSNWMLEDRDGSPRFVLTDGGLAHQGAVQGFGRGTPRYMAPEVTQEGAHDHRADLYSLALVAYRLATGREPFEGRAGEVLGKRRRLPAPRASSFHPEIGADLDAMLASLLAREPSQRHSDGAELLAAIAEARGTEIPAFTQEEAASSTSGGALVGRHEAQERFRAMAEALQSRGPQQQRAFVQTRPAPLPENVLALTGPGGSGTTRLTREMLARAREHELPTVVLAGDAHAGALQRPLSDLRTALESLLPEDNRTRRAPRPRREAVHGLNREIEDILSIVERAARAQPFVLGILHFDELSEDVRHALHVMVRFLLARHEASHGNNQLPVAMVLDLGESDPAPLLIPDVEHPEAPVIKLEPLTTEEILEICRQRLPGLELDPVDGERLATRTAGRPAHLVRLLGAALVRNDLTLVGDRWLWDLAQLDDYDTGRTIKPHERLLLDQAPPKRLEALALLSLMTQGMPLPLFEELWGGPEATWGEYACLMHKRGRGPLTLVIARTGLLREGLAGEGNLIPELWLRALATSFVERHAQELPLTTRTRLLLLLGRHEEAYGHAVEALTSEPAAQQLETRKLVLDCLLASPELLSDLERAAKICEHLGTDGASRRLSRLISDHAALSLGPLAALQLVLTLESQGDALQALAVLSRPQPHWPIDVVSRMAAAEARLRLSQRDPDRARLALRRPPLRGRSLRAAITPRARVELFSAHAQLQLMSGHGSRALALLSAGRREAREARLYVSLAKIYNNLGIVAQAQDDLALAESALRRSQRIRRAIGDLDGVLASSYNLARVLQLDGRLAESSAVLQSTATLALRHGQYSHLSATLILLATQYDQQLNTKLALATLERAWRESLRNEAVYRSATVSWYLAPVAAATGQFALVRRALANAASIARTTRSIHYRATYQLCRAIVNLHCGLPERARLYARRAASRREHLSRDAQRALTCLLAIASPADLPPISGRRPRLADSQRTCFRLHVWGLRRLKDSRSTPRSPSLARNLPLPGVRRGVSGRDRRFLTEASLAWLTHAAASERPVPAADDTRRQLEHTGEHFLCARVLSVTAINGARPTQERVLAYSQATARAADLLLAETPRPTAGLPSELIAAYAALTPQGETPQSPPSLTEVQARAHRLVTAAPTTSRDDSRVSHALRQVLRAAAQLDATNDLGQLLRSITDLTIEITGAERACVVQLLNEDDHVVTSAGTDDATDAHPVSKAVIDRVLREGRALLLHDVFEDEELMQRPSITQLSLRSIMCAPMIKRGRVYGVVYADDASAAAAFDQVDLEILSLFAEQVAGTLETRQLVDELRHSMSELRSAQDRLVSGERLRTLGELSSGVAHEFNNLLTGILARIQLLRLSSLPSAATRDVQLIESAALDAAEIVRRLQGFSRRQRERGFEDLDMREVCAESVEFLRPLWSNARSGSERSVRVICESDARVHGNPTEMREVVTNLVKNALDASHGEPARIVVRVSRRADLVTLDVRDRGSGMPEEVRRHAFEPFFTTKGDGGTGLGLPLCAQIVERHGGKIGIRSAPGEGTTVSVELPRAGRKKKPRDVATQDEAGASHMSSLPSPKGLRILVVDDDEDVREPLAEYLESLGHHVTRASSGDAALKILHTESGFDVAVSDIYMPGLDGIEFCRRARDYAPETVVVLMTGRTSRANDATMQDSGAQAVIAKPFALQSVGGLIADIARERQ